MKKLLPTLLIGCLIAFGFTDTQAQDTRFGLKGGLNFFSIKGEASISFMGFSETETFDSGTQMGFHGGIFMEKPLNEFLSIQPEINFIQKGGSESDGGVDDFVEFEDEDVTLSYIDVPLLLKINIPLEGNLSPFITAGGYVGYLLDAKVKFDGTVEDISDDVKDISYGLLFGAGVNFGNFFVELRYDYGLSNIFDTDLFDEDLNGDFDDDFGFGDIGFDVSIRNRGLSLAVGIMF